MTLPNINAQIEFTTTIPSTGQEVRFRPFLVKEEKSLLFASESRDNKVILNALVNIIEACFKGVNAKTLTVFDMEYLFLQLRARSVGEVHEVQCVCSKCQTKNDLTINLDKIDIEYDVPGKVDLNETYSLHMRWPTVRDIMSLSAAELKDPFSIVPFFIDAVATTDSIIKFSESPKKEQMEFIEQLNNAQFAAIEKVVKKMPALHYEASFVCKSCGEKNDITFHGLSDFFSL